LPALPPDPLPGAMCSFSTKWAILPVLERHGLTWPGLIARNNRMEYVNARAEIYVLLRERKWSYLQIAKLVSRDHTTVINSVQRYHARKETK
jgi:chromosomal replication initiation ATPase DnaA